MRNVIQCVVPENIHTPLRRATKIQRQVGGGGGIQKEAISSPGAPSTIDEQDISYFIFNQCFKAKIIFSSMIFYLPSAECVFFYFHGLHDSLLVYVVTRLSSTHG